MGLSIDEIIQGIQIIKAQAEWDYPLDWQIVLDGAIETMRKYQKLEQEPTTKSETLVSLGVYKQVAWERDIAIQQLHELGYEFGQKIQSTTKNDLGVDREQLKTMIRGLTKWYVKRDNTEVGEPNTAVGLLYDDVMFGIDRLPSVTPQEPFKPMVEIDLDYVIKQKYIEREVLDKIKAEILEEKECAYADFERYKVEYLGQEWEDVLDSLPQDDFRYGMERAIELIDKYKAESEKE